MSFSLNLTLFNMRQVYLILRFNPNTRLLYFKTEELLVIEKPCSSQSGAVACQCYRSGCARQGFSTYYATFIILRQKNKRTKDLFAMGSRTGNHRFPNLSNTNSQKCENSFSHSCKLVLLYRRIVLHATCFTHSKQVTRNSRRHISLTCHMLNLMYLCSYVQ